MERPVWFYVVCALWALAMLALLVSAARLSYRIEERSGQRPLTSRLPGYANVLPTAFNWRVARDGETQALRWRMNRLLFAMLAILAVPYGLLWLSAGP